MADAERLALRKLLSRAIMDIITSPGPPLPRTHPSPSLLAKMAINVHTLYDEARSLAKSIGDSSFVVLSSRNHLPPGQFRILETTPHFM